MKNSTKKKQNLHSKRFDKFGFKNGIELNIELDWKGVVFIVACALIWKYFQYEFRIYRNYYRGMDFVPNGGIRPKTQRPKTGYWTGYCISFFVFCKGR